MFALTCMHFVMIFFLYDSVADPFPPGMYTDTWDFSKKRLSSGQPMSFCVWEFGGQVNY